MGQGIYPIQIVTGNTFACKEDETVLNAAIRQRVKIPVGCKGGACSICKIKIVDGQVDHGIYSKKALPDQGRQEGFTLACQARPRSPLTIEIIGFQANNRISTYF